MSKKKQAQERRELLAKIEADRRRGERRRAYLVAGGVGLVVIAIVVGTIVGLRGLKADEHTETASGGGDIEGLQEFEVSSRNHVEEDVDYPQSPPVGGDHNPRWLNCGTYDEEVPPTSAVHSMEHGAVWLTYQPDIDADQTDVLDGIVDAHDYALVSPYADQDSPIVASAWGVQLSLDDAKDDRLEDFLTTYLQGKQTPEPGAPCTGGIGS